MIFYTTTSNGKKKVKLQWATIITMHHIRCYYCYYYYYYYYYYYCYYCFLHILDLNGSSSNASNFLSGTSEVFLILIHVLW